jgi:protein TonB
MANPMSAEAWLTPPKDGRRFMAAIAVGLAIELFALGILLPWVAHRIPVASNTPAPIKISIVSPAPPAPPKPPPPVPTPPKAVTPPPPLPTPPVPVTPPLPLPPPVLHHVATRHIPRPVHHVITPPVVQPPPPLPATPPPPAPPPAAAAPPSEDELAQFAAAMHRALQEALIFPDSAQMAHESGTVRIRFDYLDGAVSNITVISSCGYPELDEAAVQTARAAHYPPPPSDFAGHTENMDVDVIFPAAAPSVDSD